MEFEEPQGRAVAVWFGPEESPLFGLVNSGGRDIRGAVILCPPLGREEKDCYSTFAQLAAALARVGFLALRFDYRSTADSFDRSSTDDSGCGLLDDVRSAIDFVRDLGAPSVALVGMRMGALLAGLVSATEPVEAVVMWDPCSSGHAFVREQRMLSLRIPVDHSDTDHIPDFHLPVAMLRELSTMKMDETTASLAGRVLLLTRDDGLEDHRLVGHLTSPRTEHRKVAGQPELLDLPTPFQVVPAETVALIASWIDAAMPVVTRAVTLPTADEVTVPLPPAKDDRPRSEAGRPTAVVERALRLGSLGLFAISTEPNRGHKGPTCIFVSVANEHRIGPGRLWVELSRRLAAYGFHSVRLDLSGYGDSPARGAPPSVYSISAVDDVVEAARSLRPDDPSDVLLFGLCFERVPRAGGGHPLAPSSRLRIEPNRLVLGAGDAIRLATRPPAPVLPSANDVQREERQPLVVSPSRAALSGDQVARGSLPRLHAEVSWDRAAGDHTDEPTLRDVGLAIGNPTRALSQRTRSAGLGARSIRHERVADLWAGRDAAFPARHCAVRVAGNT